MWLQNKGGGMCKSLNIEKMEPFSLNSYELYHFLETKKKLKLMFSLRTVMIANTTFPIYVDASVQTKMR